MTKLRLKNIMKREKLEQLSHIIAGGLILIYGFQSFEAGDFSTSFSYIFVAIILLIVAGSHEWISQKFLHADSAIFLFEASMIFFTAWQFKTKGYWVIVYLMMAASILYFVFAIILLVFNKGSGKRHKKRKRTM